LGIVFKQSFRNTLIIYLGFVFGGINALFLYTRFLKDEYYGLVTYLLSTANLLMPLTAFGVQFTIIKFYSFYQTKPEKDAFLSSMLLLPLIIAIPIGFIGSLFYNQIGDLLSEENPIIKEYTFVIYLVAIATAYFEIFYAWSKVQLQSVFGNILKELWNRIVAMILLFAVFLDWISKEEFIYYLTAAYFIRTLLMMLYAFKLYRLKFTFSFPENFPEILKYSAYIILAGSASAILLDIDKAMLPSMETIEVVAYYGVAVYIGSTIEAPGRAMSYILQPLTSKAVYDEDHMEISSLYKKSSINLFVICGLFFLLINASIKELYLFLPDKYSGGVFVVLMISVSKLYSMAIGNNGAIISNSKYYKILLPYGIAMALSVAFLNVWLINLIGINGAALSTLLVVLLFNSIKVWYVEKKFSMWPFTKKSGQLLLIILLFFMAFYFWDFPFHPLINMMLKSILITILYVFVIKKRKISDEINEVLAKYLPFF